jgi:hypothetical protein
MNKENEPRRIRTLMDFRFQQPYSTVPILPEGYIPLAPPPKRPNLFKRLIAKLKSQKP